MQRAYAIGYRNNSTNGEWVLITRRDNHFDAIKCFKSIKDDYQNSDLAVFFYRSPEQYWADGAIRYAQLNWQEKPIRADLGGLINSRESDWF